MSLTRRLLMAAAFALALPGAASAADGDMSLGDPNAKVTVVEYASVTCSHCARWHTEVFPTFKKRYVDTGKVRFILREFPTAPTTVAAAGFLIARCAGDEKYFQVVDTMMRGQRTMFETMDFRGAMLRAAQSAGMTEAQFETCVEDEAALKAFNERAEAAMAAGVDATPTFVINGQTYVGEQSMRQLKAIIRPLLK